MSLKNYSHDELERMSMIELANAVLMEEKKAMDFKEIFEKIAEVKNLSETDKQTGISQFYTDLNVDGRFLTIGSNKWGLKRWYPVDQIDEEVTAAPKKKKKKKKKAAAAVEEDVGLEEEELDIPDEEMDEIIDDYDEEEEEVVDELDADAEFEEEEEDKI
ncbi:DNA-directed RNA polymerase subunit delta [Virgibacillus sp. YIM 98842]|uniref:DNA-directed RNA polymerase subunit delta n=1 Tax=Virgibacillus sp. YIM 98842 TaxID=2663533 RepID=UPI0013DA8417|nr:DNA-directed RNA polymerase subunit delta [Virgibacillus sp. YIM 98842]